MQKHIKLMNIKLNNVISGILGVSVQSIIDLFPQNAATTALKDTIDYSIAGIIE